MNKSAIAISTGINTPENNTLPNQAIHPMLPLETCVTVSNEIARLSYNKREARPDFVFLTLQASSKSNTLSSRYFNSCGTTNLIFYF
jgi:hypothetical protein